MATGRKLILYVLYFIFVVAVGVTLLVAFRHNNPKKPTAKPIAGNHTISTPNVAPKPAVKSPADSPSNPTTVAAGQATRTALNQPASPTKLVNTGPGSSLAIFGLVSILSAIGFRLVQLRRLS